MKRKGTRIFALLLAAVLLLGGLPMRRLRLRTRRDGFISLRTGTANC